MKQGSLLFAVLFFVLPVRSSDGTFFHGKIRAVTMVLERSLLAGFDKDDNFKSFVLTNEYHDRFLAKDQILLTAHIGKQNDKTVFEPRELEQLDKGQVYYNELRYSVYSLTKKDIETILGAFKSDPPYFLLEPILFKGDNRYLAYKITPADSNKKPVSYAITDLPMGTKGGSSGTAFAIALYLNPSPPAASSLEISE